MKVCEQVREVTRTGRDEVPSGFDRFGPLGSFLGTLKHGFLKTLENVVPTVLAVVFADPVPELERHVNVRSRLRRRVGRRDEGRQRVRRSASTVVLEVLVRFRV